MKTLVNSPVTLILTIQGLSLGPVRVMGTGLVMMMCVECLEVCTHCLSATLTVFSWLLRSFISVNPAVLEPAKIYFHFFAFVAD